MIPDRETTNDERRRESPQMSNEEVCEDKWIVCISKTMSSNRSQWQDMISRLVPSLDQAIALSSTRSAALDLP